MGRPRDSRYGSYSGEHAIVYRPISPLVWASTAQEQLVEVAKMLVASGQDKLKMVVATGSSPVHGVFGQPTDDDILRDVERVRAVREAVGDKVELMIDGNQNATLAYASRLAKLLEPFNLTWFEDPVLLGDPRLMARLRKEAPMPIAGGSSGTSDLLRFREYLLNEAVDFSSPTSTTLVVLQALLRRLPWLRPSISRFRWGEPGTIPTCTCMGASPTAGGWNSTGEAGS